MKDTKSLISLLYNQDNKILKNKKKVLNDIINTNIINERKFSFSKFNETVLYNKNKKHEEDMKLENNIKSEDFIHKSSNNKCEENIDDNIKKNNSELNVIMNNNKNDTDDVFNKENKEFNFCSFLIYKLSFYKKYKKYAIYSNFRKKIISEEQLIKNHIIIYNLITANNLNKQIYSLKEIINND